MIRRARVGLAAAVASAAVIVAVQFPLTQLWHERSAEAAAAHELAGLRRADAALSRQVASLRDPSTIGSIAHQDYGLVMPGESYEVVLPGPADARSGDPLADTKLPPSALVPSDSAIAQPATDGTGQTGANRSFWSRLLQRLEFWKASP